MITWKEFSELTKVQKINRLYRDGSFVVSIRYYSHKVNLYLLGSFYVEVFYDPKKDCIEKIIRLDTGHTRMKFYYDQIKLPKELAAQLERNWPIKKAPLGAFLFFAFVIS